jgi:glycosyltransferase involved in cell wall biosynthesis
MNVLHVLNSEGGGASIGAYELIQAGRRLGVETKHFVVYPGPLGQPASQRVTSLAAGSRVFPMPWWNKKRWLGSASRLGHWLRANQQSGFGRVPREQLRRLVEEWRIDIVHSNTAAINHGALVAAEMGIPHVWHIRERIGSSGFMQFDMPDNELARTIGELSERIVPMSGFAGEIFYEHGQGHKTTVVYDGVDVERFNTPAAGEQGRQLRRSWGVPDDAVLMAKIAAVTSQVKRHALFIQTAGELGRRFPDLWFVVIGALPTAGSWLSRGGRVYYDNLQAMVKEAGIRDRFVWAGNVPDIPALMNAFDIMVHTCEIEGFGRVAIEAMAAARPVVGPAQGGIAESVLDGKTGMLVEAGDADAFAAAAARLVEDAQLRRTFGAAGRAHVSRDFSLERHVQQMEEIYGQALRRPAYSRQVAVRAA